MLHNNKHYDTKDILANNPPPNWWFEKGKSIKQWCRKVISEQHQANQFARQVAFRQRELAAMLGIDVKEVILAFNEMIVTDDVKEVAPIPVIDKPKKKWWKQWKWWKSGGNVSSGAEFYDEEEDMSRFPIESTGWKKKGRK